MQQFGIAHSNVLKHAVKIKAKHELTDLHPAFSPSASPLPLFHLQQRQCFAERREDPEDEDGV